MLLDELQARFVPRFKLLAVKRLADATSAVVERDFDRIAAAARDLHAIAGESGLLGLGEIAAQARAAETRAHAASTSRDTVDVELLVAAVGALGRLVESLPGPSKESQ